MAVDKDSLDLELAMKLFSEVNEHWYHETPSMFNLSELKYVLYDYIQRIRKEEINMFKKEEI